MKAQQVSEPPATFKSVLGQANVRALWLASLIAYIGDTFSIMALFILINDVTHSTAALGAVGLVQTLPLFLGIAAGALVDRWRYRPILLLSDLLRAALIPLYLLFQAPGNLWFVLIVALAVSVVSRFFLPASSALRRALLRPEEYKVAAALWQATVGISYVVGPLLAGLIISSFGGGRTGITVAFAIDSCSFLLSAAIIFFGLRQDVQAVDEQREAEEQQSAWAELREGIAIMWQSRPIRGVIVLYAVGLLGVGAVFVLVVPYVQQLFAGGALEIGSMEAIQAVGLAIGAVGVGTIAGSRIAAGNLMLLASLAGGLAVVALGLAPIYLTALAAMMIAGAAAGVVQSAGAAVTLHEIPQRHQGKGSATLNTVLNGAYLLSIGVAGVAGEAIGIRQVFVIGGLIALLGVFLAVPLLKDAVKPTEHKGATVSGDAVTGEEALTVETT